jgi:RNase P subunit RPR2
MTNSQTKNELSTKTVITLCPEAQRTVCNQDGTITVHIPINFRKHGGRRYIIMPDAVQQVYKAPVEKESLLKAIGQAFEWKAMLDEGKVTTMTELAAKADINLSYLARVLRLTLLAPDIIDAILNGKQPQQLTLLEIFKSMPADWNEQRVQYGFAE